MSYIGGLTDHPSSHIVFDVYLHSLQLVTRVLAPRNTVRYLTWNIVFVHAQLNKVF